ncbi:hypothetical protein KR200_011853 [Drosophila serrata]|nr:hypothetical protein KR200_011853 [Drosophila serrata]
MTSAFLTGVYGMWNIYIFALFILYAPSHKQVESGMLEPVRGLHTTGNM